MTGATIQAIFNGISPESKITLRVAPPPSDLDDCVQMYSNLFHPRGALGPERSGQGAESHAARATTSKAGPAWLKSLAIIARLARAGEMGAERGRALSANQPHGKWGNVATHWGQCTEPPYLIFKPPGRQKFRWIVIRLIMVWYGMVWYAFGRPTT